MNTRTIFSSLATAIILIVVDLAIAFSPLEIQTSILVLDIIVIDIVIGLFSVDLFIPLISLGKRHPTEVGTLGIRWQTNIAYAALSIGFIILSYLYDISVLYQYLGQIFLFALLLTMMGAATHAAEKVAQVGSQEDLKIEGRQKMQQAIRKIKDELATKTNITEEVRIPIRDFEEKLRYITPSSNKEAVDLEKDFVNEANKVHIALGNADMNKDEIQICLLKMQRLLENRKQIYN